MSITDLERVDPPPVTDEAAVRPVVSVVLATAVRTISAAVAGLLLTCGLALVLWAVTPSSAAGPLPALRAGVAAASAGNGMTVSIGHTVLTLPPLMLTVVFIALLYGVSAVGRAGVGRAGEVACTITAGIVHGVLITVSGVLLAPAGTVVAEQWWRPGLLAVVVVGVATSVRGDGWRPYLLGRLPAWIPVAGRLSAGVIAVVLGGGAVTLVVGLVRSFGDSMTVQTLAAPGPAGGFGMFLLSLAYLPNAVVAGAGYSTGVGFTIGAGHFSPFGSSPVELPAISLLTAAPDGRSGAGTALVLLVFPLLAAVLLGRGAARRLDGRAERLLAVAGAALIAAVVLGMLAAAAAGGVAGGQWASSGVPSLPLAAVVAVAVGGLAAAICAVSPVPVAVTSAGDRESNATAEPDAAGADAPDSADGKIPAASDGDDSSGDEAGVDAAGDDSADDSAGVDAAHADAAHAATAHDEPAGDDTTDPAHQPNAACAPEPASDSATAEPTDDDDPIAQAAETARTPPGPVDAADVGSPSGGIPAPREGDVPTGDAAADGPQDREVAAGTVRPPREVG